LFNGIISRKFDIHYLIPFESLYTFPYYFLKNISLISCRTFEYSTFRGDFLLSPNTVNGSSYTVSTEDSYFLYSVLYFKLDALYLAEFSRKILPVHKFCKLELNRGIVLGHLLFTEDHFYSRRNAFALPLVP
jgi:hypothetical protein